MKIIAPFISILFILFSCQDAHLQKTDKMTMHYQSPYMQLPEEQTPSAQLDHEHPGNALPIVKDLQNGFTILLSANINRPDLENTLLEIPQMLKVCTRMHDPDDWKKQNYPSFSMPDGSIPVLEASLWLEDETNKTRTLTVGLPLSLIENPFGKHDICLQFTGVRWSIYIDNRLYDNDFAIGYPPTRAFQSWKINKEVDTAQLYIPALSMKQVADSDCTEPFNIQFWTPPFHNAWVGDVATLYHKGRYHLFYLFDRRGHGSKFGKGGHYFEHLSTTDFKHWTEHEAATPIEHQWECIGTGTPFIYNDQLCLSYGLHTTRMYPKERTAIPLQWEYLQEKGHTGSFHYDTLSPIIPAGSTYSISEDGISNFKKTHLLIHPCENPSIYTQNNGSLGMLANYRAKGTWTSDSVAGGWKCINADFPLGGDCTFPFQWNGYDYIIGGFDQLWFKESQTSDNNYIDMVKKGIDFYNGMSVPSITEIPGNRFLMAGWMKTQNWGGPLVIHELIQHADGRIGNKWMEEIVPATKEAVDISSTLATEQKVKVPQQPFILSFEVHPLTQGKGQLAVILQNEQTDSLACEWQMQLDKERAQFAPDTQQGFEPDQPTLREGGKVSTAQNYAIENGLTFDQPFTVRMLIQPSAKARGTLLDVEIGQQRTMLGYRPQLFVDQIKFLLKDIQIRHVKYELLE